MNCLKQLINFSRRFSKMDFPVMIAFLNPGMPVHVLILTEYCRNSLTSKYNDVFEISLKTVLLSVKHRIFCLFPSRYSYININNNMLNEYGIYHVRWRGTSCQNRNGI